LPKTAYRKTPKSSDQPFTVMLFVDAKKGTQHEFTQLYHEAMPQFRSEPGVVTYQLSQVKADDTKFITYEKFRSDAAFQDHLKLPAVEPVIGYLRTSIKQPPFEKGLHKLIEFAPLYRD
jgi:quinol monooxygenase YgiN